MDATDITAIITSGAAALGVVFTFVTGRWARRMELEKIELQRQLDRDDREDKKRDAEQSELDAVCAKVFDLLHEIDDKLGAFFNEPEMDDLLPYSVKIAKFKTQFDLSAPKAVANAFTTLATATQNLIVFARSDRFDQVDIDNALAGFDRARDEFVTACRKHAGRD